MGNLISVTGKVQKSIADSVRNNTYIRLEEEGDISRDRIFELSGIHRINKSELIKMAYEEKSTNLFFLIPCGLAAGIKPLSFSNLAYA